MFCSLALSLPLSDMWKQIMISLSDSGRDYPDQFLKRPVSCLSDLDVGSSFHIKEWNVVIPKNHGKKRKIEEGECGWWTRASVVLTQARGKRLRKGAKNVYWKNRGHCFCVPFPPFRCDERSEDKKGNISHH